MAALKQNQCPTSSFSLPYAHVDGSRHSSDHFRCGSYGYASSPLGGVDTYDIRWCPQRRRNVPMGGSDRHENQELNRLLLRFELNNALLLFFRYPMPRSITWESGHANHEKYKSRDQWALGAFRSDSGCDTHSQTN